MERLEEEIEWYFDRFVQKIQQLQDTSTWWEQIVKVRVKKGRVYWRIWLDVFDGFEAECEVDLQRIFAFVRRKDGAIFRAATFKAPETRTKTAIRGYVYDEDVEDYFTHYGITYAPTR
jgi:hypothetical protein